VCVIDDNREGLLKRVKLIKDLWQYEPFRTTRTLGNVRVTFPSEHVANAKATIIVYRTNVEGATDLQLVGRVEDTLNYISGQGWKTKERLVILESFKIPRNIILPP
jgi:3-phenylpropionate/cinnamic acid dioxygenase small subunit